MSGSTPVLIWGYSGVETDPNMKDETRTEAEKGKKIKLLSLCLKQMSFLFGGCVYSQKNQCEKKNI